MLSREKGRCATSPALFPHRNLLIPLRRSPLPSPFRSFHLLAPIFNFELSSPTRTSLRGGIPAGGVSACIKGQLLFFLPRGWLFPGFLPDEGDFFVSIYRVSWPAFDVASRKSDDEANKINSSNVVDFQSENILIIFKKAYTIY